jgi:ankyrin repeat protein
MSVAVDWELFSQVKYPRIGEPNIEAIKVLLRGTPPPDLASRHGNQGLTVLHHASLRRNLELVNFLIEVGAPVDCLDNAMNTPLHSLADDESEGKLAITNSLLKGKTDAERPAYVDRKNSDGETALHKATWRSDVNFIECLLDAGANLDIRNAYGRTVLDIAFENDLLDVASTLAVRIMASRSLEDAQNPFDQDMGMIDGKLYKIAIESTGPVKFYRESLPVNTTIEQLPEGLKRIANHGAWWLFLRGNSVSCYRQHRKQLPVLIGSSFCGLS